MLFSVDYGYPTYLQVASDTTYGMVRGALLFLDFWDNTWLHPEGGHYWRCFTISFFFIIARA